MTDRNIQTQIIALIVTQNLVLRVHTKKLDRG